MIGIREERLEDIDAIHDVESQAFGRENEADLVDALRCAGKVMLSLVATKSQQVVGHILFSPAILEHEGKVFVVAALGPVAVLPERQNEGIGSRLVQSGLRNCLDEGYDVVFLIGHPNTTLASGSCPPRLRESAMKEKCPMRCVMVAELRQGALTGMRGVMKFQPEFEEHR